jgi:hypothetical protein
MATEMPATKEIIAGVAMLLVFSVVMLVVLNVYKNEGEWKNVFLLLTIYDLRFTRFVCIFRAAL